MRSLLDVNVLIALFDPNHIFHERAHRWWKANAKNGWASCPLTENGMVRIMSNPKYSNAVPFTPGDLIERLDQFTKHSDHEFWADDISLRNEAVFVRNRLHNSRGITDLYLLGLAVKYKSALATFDKSIPLSAVPGAKSAHLRVL